MKRWLLIGLGGLGVLAGAIALALQPRSVAEHRFDRELGSDFDAWAAAKQQASRDAGAWETAIERYDKYADKTELAFVYIHGFGATRGEGEWLVEQLSQTYQANTWYLRLPGHGTTLEDHAVQTHLDYLDEATEALLMSQHIGEKVVLVGCSTGALLATHLAVEHPDKVDALILGSPYYKLRDPMAFLIDSDAGMAAGIAVFGQPRDARLTGPRRVEGYGDHWLETQDWNALRGLSDLARYIMGKDPVPRISQPTLMLVDPADTVVDAQAVMAAYATIPAHPNSALVELPDSNHIVWSKYVKTDKAAVTAAVDAFADRMGWVPPPPPEPAPVEEAADGEPADDDEPPTQ